MLYPMTTVSEQLRKALNECGKTRAEVARATGIPESVLSRFVNEINTLHGAHTDNLARYLKLKLMPERKER